MSEITVTLTTLSGRTESMSVSSSTSPSELREFAAALLGFDPGEEVELTRDGKPLGEGQELKNGDMVLVARRGQVRRAGGGPQRAPTTARPSAAPAPAAAPGGLDFSNLLAGAGAGASTPASASAQPAAGAASSSSASSSGGGGGSGGGSGGGGGGLSFDLPPPNPHLVQSAPVEWDGMSLDDAIRSNPHPDRFVDVLLSERHPNLMKELNYHSPNLARRMREAGSKDGARVWREEMMKGSIQSAYASTMSKKRESDMQDRLRQNPHDEEANKYFGEKIRRENVDAQYRQMMEEYPESMGRVLMLYIDAEVNGCPIQAFVDSGAQSTIMSSACAERCGLLHLLDSRFEGTAVGVGTGKILGRVHIAPLRVGGHYFPCTITVMDSEKGLGDKNMDFLFGLDMLKRHRCKIDLGRNCLVFTMGDGEMEAPFLHEKDLDENKGGTKGFDAEKSNAELEERMREAEKKQDEADEKKKKGGKDADGDAKMSGGGGGGSGGGGGKPRDDEESGYEAGVESEVMDVDETTDREQREGGKKANKKRPNGGGSG